MSAKRKPESDAALLARAVHAAPADDAPRAALADCLTEHGLADQAAHVLARTCSRCTAPEAEEGVFGRTRWWSLDYVENGMNSDTAWEEFGDELYPGLDWPYTGGPCRLYDGRWVCEACRRSLVATKAGKTRRAKAEDAKADVADLYSGVED